ncbi:MAG: 6-pyruvoyl-tetrahydropterin synthase-related protein [Patescibacteria group bacterium]
MLWLHQNRKSIFISVLIVLFCIPAVLPLLRPGFFQSDDGEWMVIRFSAFYQALADGQFPVRFLGRLNHEYGYPVANFLYPGFMYLGVPIHFLGFGFVDTVKIIFGVSMIASAIFCYLWLSRFFDKLSSFVGALFYLYAPYHLFDLYKRGSIGEVLALAVLPFILWQIERKSLFWSAISIAFLIISHNTLAVLFLGLIIVYMGLDIYISKYKKEQLKKFLLMIMFGLGISAFFWIPAFFELQYTVFSQTQVSEWGAYFADTSLVGFSIIFIILLTTIFFATSRIRIQKHRLTLLLFIISIVSVFFASSPSYHLWNILPVSFIQFPFRFLSLAIACISFLAACIISTSSKNLKIPVAVLSLIILMFSAKPFLTPSDFFDKGEGIYATNMDTTTVKNEYMPKWVKEKPIERFKEKVEIVEGVGKVETVSYNSKKITFDVLSKENMKVRVNTIYYPGWNAKFYPSRCHPELDSGSNDNDCKGKELSIDYQNNKGVMELQMPKGESRVELKFSETPLRLTSNIISFLSLLAILFLGIKIYKPLSLK